MKGNFSKMDREFMKTTEDIINLLGVIDKIYISDSFLAMMNDQSCDCDEIVIKSGGFYFRLASQAVGEDGRIVFQECIAFKKDEYPYEVDLKGQSFRFDKFSYLEDGMIDGIRFSSEEIFLFVFSLENNLVITMSKLDLLGDIEMDYLEQEAKLIIKKS